MQRSRLKAERKAAGKHIEIKDLPPSDRFSALRSEKKHFIDTIKLIEELTIHFNSHEVRVEGQNLRDLLLELQAANVEMLRGIPNRYEARLDAMAIHCISVVENASHLKEQVKSSARVLSSSKSSLQISRIKGPPSGLTEAEPFWRRTKHSFGSLCFSSRFSSLYLKSIPTPENRPFLGKMSPHGSEPGPPEIRVKSTSGQAREFESRPLKFFANETLYQLSYNPSPRLR